MPIQVTDEVEWTQTEQYVTLKVPLKGAASKYVDIFSTNVYLKVSYPPYFYEVALYDEINDDLSKAIVSNVQIIFHLEKIRHNVWKQLQSENHMDREFMKKRRSDAVEYKQEKQKEWISKSKKEKDEQKKFAVCEQMRLDSEERKQVEDSKKEEKNEIANDLSNWEKEKHSRNFNQRKDMAKPTATSHNIVFSDAGENKHLETSKKETSKTLPMPRTTGYIKVKFTKRVLPTPARESKLLEEELWMQKIAEMNKMKDRSRDTLDIEETSPVWLKDKGDEFFKKQNYVAAINAYTSALLLDPTIPMIYSNRGACHLALKQYSECIKDCSCALEHYDPPVEGNLTSRCRAYTRRGTAYYQMEDYVDALRDYQCAITLDPKNVALKADAYKIRRIIQGIESSD